MTTVFGIPIQALFGQLLVGLINGSFYALLSLGLAIIFGLLGIINFCHGALYMLGALLAWLILEHLGLGYWPALIVSPHRGGPVRQAHRADDAQAAPGLDPLYGLLLTFGLALLFQGVARNYFGVSGEPYDIPAQLSGGKNLGFMFLPNYRAWVVLVSVLFCGLTWFVTERTRFGAYLRASHREPAPGPGVRDQRAAADHLTYGLGVALAALAGVMAAPIYRVSPLMGADLIIVVFAVVVIGGMGSILGSIVTGFGLGVIEGLTKVFYPEASNTVVFVIMAIVLLVKPAGLFGRTA